jgi:hypothetical protein
LLFTELLNWTKRKLNHFQMLDAQSVVAKPIILMVNKMPDKKEIVQRITDIKNSSKEESNIIYCSIRETDVTIKTRRFPTLHNCEVSDCANKGSRVCLESMLY